MPPSGITTKRESIHTMTTAQRNIPFIDLAAQQARIRERLDARIAAVLDHGKYIMGPEIRELEAALADYVGVKHAVSCASGTDALLMALMANGIGHGDVVFTTPFTFIATAEVVALLGARVVFVDIAEDTYNIDPERLEQAIDCFSHVFGPGRLRGVIPVDLFGQPADYGPIRDIADKYGLQVWQDAAQSFGSTYKGARAGSHGDVACTSFFPAKPLGCYGDGGAVFCNDDDLAGRLTSIRVHGQGGHKYDNVRIGINGRMDTMQAAVLLEKLAIFDEEIDLRNQVAARYSEGLKDKYIVPAVRDDRTSVWAQYTVRPKDGVREDIQARLKEKGVPTAVYYPKPLHLQDAFRPLNYRLGDFPVTETVMNEVFSLPMHPYLGAEDQDYVIEALLGA